MIRLFQPGDLYLIQRLNRQRTHFLTVATLLNSHSVMRAVLGSLIPWDDAKVTTYVLRQEGHSLVSGGFLQVQKRPGAAEQDLLCIAPGLEARHGHPATWTKLLAYSLHAAMEQGIARIYCNVNDQPLPVNTLLGAGFQTYGRETVWRLFSPTVEDYAAEITAEIRPLRPEDAWGLAQLYLQVTPAPVQQAEGWSGETEAALPWLTTWCASHGDTYVLVEEGRIAGALQIVGGRLGCWMQFWTDTLRPDGFYVRQLLYCGLTIARERRLNMPAYVAVADHHGGVAAQLTDLGFVPFSDRVKMVKHVVQWVRESVTAPAPALEAIAETVPTPFAPPEGAHAQVGATRQPVAP